MFGVDAAVCLSSAGARYLSSTKEKAVTHAVCCQIERAAAFPVHDCPVYVVEDAASSEKSSASSVRSAVSDAAGQRAMKFDTRKVVALRAISATGSHRPAATIMAGAGINGRWNPPNAGIDPLHCLCGSDGAPWPGRAAIPAKRIMVSEAFGL